jgi:hypothetical protein
MDQLLSHSHLPEPTKSKWLQKALVLRDSGKLPSPVMIECEMETDFSMQNRRGIKASQLLTNVPGISIDNSSGGATAANHAKTTTLRVSKSLKGRHSEKFKSLNFWKKKK